MSEFFQGAVAPEVYKLVVVPGTSGVDLTTVLSANLRVVKPDGTVSIWPADLVNQSSTQVTLRHEFGVTSDLTLPGSYIVYGQLTTTGGALTTKRVRLTAISLASLDEPHLSDTDTEEIGYSDDNIPPAASPTLPGITVKDEGSAVGLATGLNFVGPAITAVMVGQQANVTVNSTSGMLVQEEGVPVSGASFDTFNFVGADITATDAGGGVAQITVSVPTPTIAVEEEGVSVGSPFETLNFVGPYITASDAGGGVADITVSVPAPPTPTITVKDEGSTVGSSFTTLDFTGTGVTATDAGGGTATVAIPNGFLGQTTKAMADSDQTLSADEASKPILSCTGALTANRKVKYPTPAGDADTIVRFIRADVTGADLVVARSTSGGATVTIGAGQYVAVIVDPSGAYLAVTGA